MKKLNKRLSMMSTLASLLTLRGEDLEKGTWGWQGQDYWNPADKNPNPQLERNRQRAKAWPKFSLHGHNTQINLKVHCAQEIVGELRLLDPRGDMSPDHFLMLPACEDDAELFEDDPRWPQAIQECPLAQLESPLRFWAALDIIFMMAMHGFKIRTWGYNDRCVFANGTLLPDSDEPYGRFAFHMDVKGEQRYLPKDRDGKAFITPAFDVEGIDTTFPLREDEELLHGTPIKEYAHLDIPSGEDVGKCMAAGSGIGYLILLDENGNPVPRDEAGFYNQIVGQVGVPHGGIHYSDEALKGLNIPHIEEEARKLTAKFMGLPPALVTAGPVSMSVLAHTTLNPKFGIAAPVVLSDRHLNSGRELASVADLMTLAEQAIKESPVPMVMAGDFADGSGIKVMLGDRELTQAELEQLASEAPEDDTDDGDDNPPDYAVLNNPDNFVAQPPVWRGMTQVHVPDPVPHDVLSFGSALQEPSQLSRIDVVKDGVPVPDAQVQPTRQPTSLGATPVSRTRLRPSEEFISSESTIDPGTDYPHLRHLNRQQLDAYFAAKGETVDPQVEAAVEAYRDMTVNGIHERLLDHGAIEGEVVRSDHTVDGKLLGLLPADDPHDVPTTDLDLEADPANWDGFLDEPSAGAPRSEDGDKEQ